MFKYKRVVLIASAIVFLLVLFFIKNRSDKENILTPVAGLNYGGDETLEELVAKDTDLDGVADWEEGLWGTDPYKADSNEDGVLDNIEVKNLKSAQGRENESAGLSFETETGSKENITETDKFSRELFTTVVALSQKGEIDEAAAEEISGSLVEQIKNSPQKKIYKISDIKIINDNSKEAVLNYRTSLSNFYKQYPTKGNVIDILAEATSEDGSVDGTILYKLDPIIKSKKFYIDGMTKVSVPEALSSAHLNVLNALQKVVENLIDMQLFDTDVILALRGVSQYQESIDLLDSTLSNLTTISQKLNN